MFYALVMLITINGHTDSFVIDQLANRADCAAALRSAKPATMYRGAGIKAAASFRCETTRVIKGGR